MKPLHNLLNTIRQSLEDNLHVWAGLSACSVDTQTTTSCNQTLPQKACERLPRFSGSYLITSAFFGSRKPWMWLTTHVRKSHGIKFKASATAKWLASLYYKEGPPTNKIQTVCCPDSTTVERAPRWHQDSRNSKHVSLQTETKKLLLHLLLFLNGVDVFAWFLHMRLYPYG